MEARQRVQLTGTNSSIGLIYALKKILRYSKDKNYYYKFIFILIFIDQGYNFLLSIDRLNYNANSKTTFLYPYTT